MTDASIPQQASNGPATSESTLQIRLEGCTPTPLAAYLKGLGILRLVAEQADPEARGCWQADQFVLVSRLDIDALRRFLLNEYCPTPVLAPWNGGSGFYPKDNRSGIDPIEAGRATRFASLRKAIATIRGVLKRQDVTEKPSGKAKAELLAALRSELSDVALSWLDAAVLLGDESPRYPPLLGTGGNDGRLDFTNNFLQRLVSLFNADSGEPRGDTHDLLDEALFAQPVPGMTSAAIGQFSPGDAGGANQSSGFSGDALVNPWDFVLMLEGALLFAAAATRRLESASPGALSYPFTVRPTGSGTGKTALADEGAARAEMWLPLWPAPAGLGELRALLAEGRATLGRRPARDGLDFVRAVSRLGVARGIEAFQRYAFLMRSGKAYLAAPLNRVLAIRNRNGDLVDELERSQWLGRFRQLARGTQSTHRIRSLVRRIEDAIFELALAQGQATAQVQQLLALLGEAQLHLGRSPSNRETCPPVPYLSAQWLTRADDGSQELAIAAALAALEGHRLGPDGKPDQALRLRQHLAPERPGFYPTWSEEETHRVTWGSGSLADNLHATLRRRLLEAERLELHDKPLRSVRTAPLAAVAAWLAGRLDDHRITALLPGLALVKIPHGDEAAPERIDPLPAAYRLLKPFFCTDQQLQRCGVLAPEQSLPIPVEMVRRLAADDVPGAVQLAGNRLRVAGVRLQFRSVAPVCTPGRHLLATLLVPIGIKELRELLPTPPEQERQALPIH